MNESPPSSPPLLRLDTVSINLGGRPIVKDLSFALHSGRIACLLGPSGCGKTTILRAIAGFQAIHDGQILLDGDRVNDRRRTLAPERRRIGMVFQDFALFPHLSLADNIGFGIRHLSRAQRRDRVAQLLELVDLSGYQQRYPHQLSGGQQQRIALVRALAPRPRLLLMDEPFSSMDSDLRESLARDVRDILHQEQVSAILVTHDQLEAFAMSDEIGLLRDGELVQWDTGYNLYHHPTNRFVAGFIGQGVLLDAKVHSPKELDTPLGVIKGRVPEDCRAGCPVKVLIRPDDIQHDDASPMTATVRERAFRGAEFLYTLELADGSRVLSLVPSHHDHRIGERIGIVLEVDHLVTFKRQPEFGEKAAKLRLEYTGFNQPYSRG